MIIVRKGSGKIGGSESIILDLELNLPWYIGESEVLKDFVSVMEKVLNP